MTRRAEGPGALDFTALLRGWERAARVAELETLRDLARTIWHATPRANARAGARGDTRAELARRARRPAPRGEFTHAQERAVMAAGLARAQVSRAGRWLPGAYLGQLQTQLHAGAAGGQMGDRARPLAPVAPADTVAPLPGVLEAVIRALAGALTTGGTLPAPSADPAVDKPLLDIEETAGRLGVSRMQVRGWAAGGGMPSVW